MSPDYRFHAPPAQFEVSVVVLCFAYGSGRVGELERGGEVGERPATLEMVPVDDVPVTIEMRNQHSPLIFSERRYSAFARHAPLSRELGHESAPQVAVVVSVRTPLCLLVQT